MTSVDEQDELSADATGLANPMRFGDVGGRERLSDGQGEPSGAEQLGDQREGVGGPSGVASAEAHLVLPRSGEVGDRDDVLRSAGELDQAGQESPFFGLERVGSGAISRSAAGRAGPSAAW